MRRIARYGWLTLVVLLFGPGSSLSQQHQQSGTLIVSGHSGQAPITQINGRSYVAVDALARLMNGSLGFQGSQVTLTLPGSSNAGGTASPGSHSGGTTFSTDFLNAAIETMSDIREWRTALLTAVETGARVTDGWMDNYRAQAVKSLRLTSVAATTDSDRDALALLSKELDHMQELSNRFLAARKNMNYITADSVKNDPLDKKIVKCAHSLAAMAASGQFQDDGSCH